MPEVRSLQVGRATWSELMTRASSSIPWQYYWVRWVGETKMFHCSNWLKKGGEGWGYIKEG